MRKKAIVHIGIFILLAFCVESVLTYCLEPVTMQMEIERQLNYKAEQGIEPDLVILGDSTVGSGVDPESLQNEIKGVQCALNAASGNQPLQASYYYLRYLKKKYPKIQRVVLGVAYDQLIDSQTNMKKKLIVLDRIHDPELWFAYARTFMTLEDIPLLLKSYRYRDELRNIPENLKEKFRKQKMLIPTDSIGYSPYEDRLDPDHGEVGIGELNWDENSVDPEDLTALENIIEFCEDSGIEIYLVTMPVSDALFYSNNGIAGAHAYLAKISKNYQIKYLDMNLWKKRMEENVGNRMADNVHVMHDLSTELSDVIGQIVNGDNISEHLYASIDEARKQMHGILSLKLSTVPDGKGNRIMSADWICTDDMNPKLCFRIKDKNGGVLTDYGKSSKNSALLPKKYIGKEMTLEVTAYAEHGNLLFERTFQIAVNQHTWEEEKG